MSRITLGQLKSYNENSIYYEDFVFDEFQKIELLLFVVDRLGVKGDIEDFYLILGGRSLICKRHFEDSDNILQNARIHLKTLNQKKVYTDELEKYENNSENINKLYERKDDRFSIINNLSQNVMEKVELYEKLLSLEILFENKPIKYAFQDNKRYGIDIDVDDRTIELKLKGVKPAPIPKCKSKKGTGIKVSVKDLIKEGETIDSILSGEKEGYRRAVLQKSSFKAVKDGQVSKVNNIELSEVTNIVGQVGSGKSTFSSALIKNIAESGYRIVVIEPTVNSVLRKSENLTKLGVNAVPVIGGSNWKEHIKKAVDSKDYLKDYDSKVLTAGCSLGGLIDEPDITIEYGKEPCKKIYRFYEKSEDKNQLNKNDSYKCPYYYKCPRTKLQEDIYKASVIITTTAGLTTMNLGIRNMTLFRYVLENIDLVIIDEAEREMQKADKIFAPCVSYDEYIYGNNDTINNYYAKPVDERTKLFSMEYINFLEYYQLSERIFTKIYRAIDDNRHGFSKSMLKGHFTGTILINHCKNKDMLPEDVCNVFYKMSGKKRKRKEIKMLEDISNARNRKDIKEIFEDYEFSFDEDITDEQANRMIFISLVLRFEDTYREISNLVRENNDLPSSTKDILSQRFEFHQRYIPVSPTGNIFALKYKPAEGNGKGDLSIVKQFALGRSMYLRFPYLKLDADGEPIGPKVLMLSGSSFAPGSFANHIAEPVNYIIEAEDYKRKFISETYFEYMNTDINVSGSGSERKSNLVQLVEWCRELIFDKLNQKDNNILMVVNSYQDAEDVYKELINILKETEFRDKIAYLVSDKENEEDGRIKQSKISGFNNGDYRILIAPAILIERGHNIVDDKGNAAFDTLIFMTRPMEKPGDYISHVSKVNGYIMEKYSGKNYAVDTEIFKNMRKDAYTMYNDLDSPAYSIEDLKPMVQRDIVVTQFVTVLQTFGRLCRIGSEENIKDKAPEVYFADAAFKAKGNNKLDMLNEMVDYIGKLIESEGTRGEIAKTLYQPFYTALRKGRNIYGTR